MSTLTKVDEQMKSEAEVPEAQAPTAVDVEYSAAELINIHMRAQRDAVARERERADIEDAFAPAEPIAPATDEASFRSGMPQHYRRARQDQQRYLRDIFDFAVWFDAYAESLQDHANPLACPTGRRAKTGLSAIVDEMREKGEIGWKYSTVRAYRSMAGFEWDAIAKCGSVKKALEWCANQNRTEADRTERKERKARMRNKESELERENRNLGVQNDMKTKRIRELEEENRLLRAAADPTEYKAMEESVASHVKAERAAYKKVDAIEAEARGYKAKMERQGRELGAARVALAERPRARAKEPWEGADDGSTLSLGIGENRGRSGEWIDPGDQF